ncbi:hypothetical protein [Sphingomonas sp. DC2300-3]|uniref:hypothetical protein n=1 Tax=unclassified Sphingomonas TaxID=196159 RepID=UPI003CE6B5CE
MTWYQSGSVTVTQGSATVTGAGTDFMAPNVFPGDGFVDEAGYTYEVVGAQSSTQLTISPAYRGASGGGRGYKIMPLQDYQRLLAQRAADLIGSFASVRDGVGQGMFPDGTAAAPGIRFSADQDSGLRRLGSNIIALVAGGVDRLTLDGDGATVSTGGGPARLTIAATAEAGRGGSILFTRAGAASGFIGDAGAALGGTETTGLVYYTYGGDPHRFFAGGAERMRVTNAGAVGIGTPTPAAKHHVNEASAAPCYSMIGNPSGMTRIGVRPDGASQVLSYAGQPLLLGSDNLGGVVTEWGRFDAAGNLLVGVGDGSRHRITKTGAETQIVVEIGTPTAINALFYAVTGGVGSSVRSGMTSRADSTTGRSINAGGTINASGADYAEYVRKSLACGTILKGDVCGIDSNGELTRTWADARRYVVKSTDPNLVGGDTWAAHLGPRPEEPLYAAPTYGGSAEPTKPIEPTAFVPPVIEMPVQPVRADGEDDDAYLLRLAAFLNDRNATIAMAQAAADAQVEAAKAQVAYTAAVEQYQADLAAYRDAQAAYRTAVDAAEAAHAVALAAHGEALTAWEAELEAARQTVDRIAFSGQVPVNVDADTLAACQAALGDGVAVYLVAVARGAGIGVTAVREADMTLPLYMRRLGAVWAIRDGRPWIDVQHG